MNTTHTTPLPASGGHEDDDDNATTAPPAGGHPGNDQVGFGQVGNPAQTASSAQFGSSFDTASFGSASTSFGAGPQARPDHPLDTPLPYGSGFSTTQPLGYGTGPMDLGIASYGSLGDAANGAVEVADRKKSGSPVLAVAGILSMAVAVWAILGGPVITPTVLLATGLVFTVIVGLVMVVRR